MGEIEDQPAVGAEPGPWLPTRRRAMSPAERRRYQKEAGLDPTEAVAWADSNIGPYEAATAISNGMTVNDVLDRREQRRIERTRATARNSSATADFDALEMQAWRHEGFDADDVTAWTACPVPDDEGRYSPIVIAFTPEDAARWRAHGFSADEAAIWAVAGVEPVEAASARARGVQRPTNPRLESSDDRPVIVWGTRFDLLYLGELTNIEGLLAAEDETRALLESSTWAEFLDILGVDSYEEEFGYQLDDLWIDADPERDEERPRGWLPPDDEGVPDLSGDWLSNRQRIDDPVLLDLPDELFELGRRSASMVAGDFISWDPDDLVEIARAARSAGCTFERRQELFDLPY